MVKRIIAIIFIYVCACAAWFILGATVMHRTHNLDSHLKEAVSQIWGSEQTQQAPLIGYDVTTRLLEERVENGRAIQTYKTQTLTQPTTLAGSDLHVDFHLDHRRKGLLWYATYQLGFNSAYRVTNDTGEPQVYTFTYRFPSTNAVYDNFQLAIGNREEKQIVVSDGTLERRFSLAPGKTETIRVGYTTQGLNRWTYSFGEQVSQVKNFKLAMTTDFERIDFPAASIAPTRKAHIPGGWKLHWEYKNLLTAVTIGMEMPQRLNPGPWVSEVIFVAPVSLFLFFFLIFVITALRGIRLHPMHYFFLAAGFFSFHLLLAYLVDHWSVELSVAVASLVSVALVVSYMRLVVNARFAFVEVALAQIVYLVLFSCTFFLEGYTGLAITLLCITTLFVVMQATGRLDWEAVFAENAPKKAPKPPTQPPSQDAA